MAIYSNLSKQVQKLSLMIYMLLLNNTKTFQLRILCLKFCKFYVLLNFEPQNVVRFE